MAADLSVAIRALHSHAKICCRDVSEVIPAYRQAGVIKPWVLKLALNISDGKRTERLK
ncbi:MAG: hypothetical protein H8E54_06655 [Candidatus Aminicenantes bacterium]|nr:hypothetical protein [Candidatus Aminicenantes bacterium]